MANEVFKEELKQFLCNQVKRSSMYFNNIYNRSGTGAKISNI